MATLHRARKQTGIDQSTETPAADPRGINRIKEKGVKKPFPGKIEPMLSTLVRDAFTGEEWIYEVKFDGYRILSYKNQEKISLKSRKVDFTKEFPSLVKELARMPHDLVLDGEMVALNEQGLPDFQTLQNYKKGADLKYYVFDILYLDGYDLTRLELTERRKVLQELLPQSGLLTFSRSFDDGVRLYQAARGKGLEGIMAKRRDSLYTPGKRSANWLKIPLMNVEEFVIGGWTESETGQAFRSMLFGYYDGPKLVYAGHVAHGFSEQQRKAILEKLIKLETRKSPFSGEFPTATKARWVRPELVASIEYADWTTAGNIRKPAIFKSWRPDKAPQEAVPETALTKRDATDATGSPEPSTANKAGALSGNISAKPDTSYLNTDSNWKDLDKLTIDRVHELPVEGVTVRVYNLDKILWEEPPINKAALLAYYGSMSPYILPYLKDRPLSLYIKHISPTAPGLYIKDMEGRQPGFAEVFQTHRKHKKKGKRDIIEYLVCNNTATLLYIINLGAIDLNPWSSTVQSPETPDYITIDLDPSDGDFQKAVEVARAASELFAEKQLKTFVKTSGKTGLHILIPCSGFSFAEARAHGSRLCDEIQQRTKGISTRERAIHKRGNLLYVDDSQNDFADTIASPYSVRPYPIPMVSTPLDWKEVNKQLDPANFTIQTIGKRVERKGDLFRNLFDLKIKRSNNQQLRQLVATR